MQGVGFILICIASTMMDSERLVIPMAVAAVGALMVWRGSHAR